MYITIATIIGSINIWLILNEVIISYAVKYDMSKYKHIGENVNIGCTTKELPADSLSQGFTKDTVAGITIGIKEKKDL